MGRTGQLRCEDTKNSCSALERRHDDERMAAFMVAVGRRWRLTPKNGRQISVIYRNAAFLDSFQYLPGISLELLENAAFPFASRRALKYR
jgi:hypothetical protein